MSPLQFQHSADGQMQLVGRSDVVLKLVGGKASIAFPEWERTLGLPKFQEEWDALAIARGLSPRFLRFVLCDESPTRQVGNWRMQPARIRVQPGWYRVTLGHNTPNYVIGRCPVVQLHSKEMTRIFKDLPDFVEGGCLVGEAQLYDSGLADIAWRGLQQHIFSHVCAVESQTSEDQAGTGDLQEIALVSEVEAGCPGAKVLKSWAS